MATNKADIMQAIDMFIEDKVMELTGGNGFMKLAQPTIKRGVRNSLKKYENGVDKFLNFITDENGNTDLEGILNETLDVFQEMESVPVKIPYLDNAFIGQGKIEFDVEIPMVNKIQHIAFTMDDFNQMKDLILAAKSQAAVKAVK